jgi:UDP-N-acetylglucosamine 2-epimerase (non-hydrolysing)
MSGLFLVAGARPNFMETAPLDARLCEVPDVDTQIVHTGQHYDEAMPDVS